MPDQPARPTAKQPSRKPAAPASKPAAKSASRPAAKRSATKQSAAKPGAKSAAKSAVKKAPAAKQTFAMEKADPALLARVEALMPEYPVYRRPMFGVVSWFVEANAALLGCVWGESLNLRVGAEDARALIDAGKATPFDPMGGRPMREYVLVPASTLRPAQLRAWIERALAFTQTVPAKKGK